MNIFAILVAAAVAFVVGFLLHGPLFGKLWMRLANVHPTGNEKLSDMLPQMAWNFFANIVSATVLSGFFMLVFSSPLVGARDAFHGVEVAFLVWFGFMLTNSSMEVIWMGRTAKLWLFEAMCSLCVLATMGAILATWGA